MANDMDKQLEDLAKTIRAMERVEEKNPEMFESQKVGIERMLADPKQAEYLEAVAKEIVGMYIEDKNHHGEAIEVDMMEKLNTTEVPVMQFNTCDHCGADGGRAGMCFGTSDREGTYCQNCHDTDMMGDVVIHARLQRTEEELAKTMELVKTIVPMYPDEISVELINAAGDKLSDGAQPMTETNKEELDDETR